MKNFSQAHQDQFVITCLEGKRNGFFLDLGCNDPIEISNTYLLEKEYGWTGIAIDIDEDCVRKFNGLRTCKALCEDGTKVNYLSLLMNMSHIDYLSLDLEPADVTLDCLKNIPLDKIEFSVVTYEHDEYRFGSKIKNDSRKIFLDRGYYLLCKDVKNSGCSYEDWYVNPKYVDISKLSRLSCEGLDHNEIALRF